MAQSYTGTSQNFGSANKVIYEGRNSSNSLSFKYHNPERGCTQQMMKEQYCFSMSENFFSEEN